MIACLAGKMNEKPLRRVAEHVVVARAADDADVADSHANSIDERPRAVAAPLCLCPVVVSVLNYERNTTELAMGVSP